MATRPLDGMNPSVDFSPATSKASRGSLNPFGRRTIHSTANSRLNIQTPDRRSRASEYFSERFRSYHFGHRLARSNAKKLLRVLKFGGTSVGDASCISKVAEIIRASARETSAVVVVSAMSGVTNKLIEAAAYSEAGDSQRVAAIFEELRERHDVAVSRLIHSVVSRNSIARKLRRIFCEGEDLCEGAIQSGKLAPHERDFIAGLGERACAPLVAAVLAEKGIASEAVEATEIVVTDSNHGGADPRMDLTRERCQSRLQPLLHQGIVPVVTGFIGATPEGMPTTLGRGGSDYSATILGAALDAQEVVIWTDVDGVLTADPRLVPDASAIPEISYQVAADLAYFGAKVLHPKTLRPVMESQIPVWIRNTFAPQHPGTKVTSAGLASDGGVKAITALSDVTMITVGAPGAAEIESVLDRTVTAASSVRAEVLLILPSSLHGHIRFVMPSGVAQSTVEALRQEFSQDLAEEKVGPITCDPGVAIVTLVGQKMRGASEVMSRALCALGSEKVNVIASAHGSTECNLSFVVARQDMQTALLATHREFNLGSLSPQELATTSR
jgi:aspartokinase/homoserine dehydrogenase 1